jgi:hypothetical protein
MWVYNHFIWCTFGTKETSYTGYQITKPIRENPQLLCLPLTGVPLISTINDPLMTCIYFITIFPPQKSGRTHTVFWRAIVRLYNLTQDWMARVRFSTLSLYHCLASPSLLSIGCLVTSSGSEIISVWNVTKVKNASLPLYASTSQCLGVRSNFLLYFWKFY